MYPRSRGQAVTRGRGLKPALPVFLTGTQIPARVLVGLRWGPGCAGGLSIPSGHTLLDCIGPSVRGVVLRTGSAARRRVRILIAVPERRLSEPPPHLQTCVDRTHLPVPGEGLSARNPSRTWGSSQGFGKGWLSCCTGTVGMGAVQGPAGPLAWSTFPSGPSPCQEGCGCPASCPPQAVRSLRAVSDSLWSLPAPPSWHVWAAV